MEGKSEFETIRHLAEKLDNRATDKRDAFDNSSLSEIQEALSDQMALISSTKERLETAKGLFEEKKQKSLSIVDEHCTLRFLTAYGRHGIKGEKE